MTVLSGSSIAKLFPFINGVGFQNFQAKELLPLSRAALLLLGQALPVFT